MRLRHWITRAVPFVISTSLLVFIVWWVSPQALLRAAEDLRWQLLVPATVAMVVALYLCDALCLPVAYGIEGRQIRYAQALHVRGLAYLAGALNYEIGQGAVAWGMARLQQTKFLRMLARSIVLAYHDAVILLATGLVGALLTNNSRVVRIRPYIAIGLAAALIVGVVFWSLPKWLRLQIHSEKIDAIFADWSLQRSLQLVPLRFAYFGILVFYAAVALAICRIPVDHVVVLSTIPLVLLADGLPNFAGLGTRETSLLLLLAPDEKGPLLAMSLLWTTGMIVIRFLIGVSHLWYHQFRRPIAGELRSPD
jgi:hypothetical protein